MWVTMKRSAYPFPRLAARHATPPRPLRAAASLRVGSRVRRASLTAACLAANLRAGKAAAAKDGAPPDGGDDPDFRCLVRATDGKRKFSTAVRAARAPRVPRPRCCTPPRDVRADVPRSAPRSCRQSRWHAFTRRTRSCRRRTWTRSSSGKKRRPSLPQRRPLPRRPDCLQPQAPLAYGPWAGLAQHTRLRGHCRSLAILPALLLLEAARLGASAPRARATRLHSCAVPAHA